MKIIKLVILLFLMNFQVNAQEVEEYSKDNLSITFKNFDPTLKEGTEEKFVSTVFEVYPKLLKDFNPNAQKHITIKIDTSYTGVAYASNGEITVSSRWLKQKPTDIDLITHEVMHLIQSYPHGGGPVWLSEGVADYVRFKYGVDNPGAGWSLTDFNKNQSYTNSYRITARFLVWLSENYDDSIVYKLDKQMRSKTYSEDSWKNLTGKDIDSLWLEYSGNSEIYFAKGM